MKKALLLCATHNDLGLIRSLKKLGFYIIDTGGIKNLHGEKLCDKFIFQDYSDKKKILAIAKKEKISAIISLIVPLFVSAFQRSDELANAMEARGYDPSKPRSKYRKLIWKMNDTLSCIFILLIFSGILTLSILKIVII